MKLGIVTMPFATFAEVPLRAAAAASALALAPVAPPTLRDAVAKAPAVIVAAYPRRREPVRRGAAARPRGAGGPPHPGSPALSAATALARPYTPYWMR